MRRISNCSSHRPAALAHNTLATLALGVALAASLPGCIDLAEDDHLEAELEARDPASPALDGAALDGAALDGAALDGVALDGAARVAPAAAAGLFSSVLDQDSVSWASVRNLSSSAFSADFRQRSGNGYMVIDIDVIEIDGQERVSAVWKKNSDGRGWRSLRNLTSSEFAAEWQDMLDRGYLLIDQESYVLAGTRYYAGVWIENVEGLGWASYRNVTSATFSEKFQQYRDAGYIPIDVEGYPYGSGTRYSAIWVQNRDGFRWAMLRDMSSSTFSTRFNDYKDSYRVMDFESYQRSGNQSYAAIWIENKNHRHWRVWRDMTAAQYSNTWKRLRDEGFRVIDFEVYSYGRDYRYAAVWRQNNIRPQWSHKGAVDQLLEDAMNDADIPGMSVAIAKDGQFLYMRGLGFADIDAQRIAYSGTIYRLASVSKAVAGVLGLDLERRGFIDLDDDTRDLVPSLPAHHTHRVWQTLTNRSGIGHYSQNGSPGSSQHFDTAVDALAFFQDNPLNFTPGTDYLYSTHAYTAAGAAFESAMGDSITDIVDTELNQRYSLGSLLAEDRTAANSNRASLYSWNGGSNVEVSADDLSWKVLGGGMESSVYDLVRFGNKLLAGAILDAAGLNTLWTRPDAQANYAYGWNTGTDQCAAVVAKNGGQRGAKSYIRIYPDHGIVIAVLTNRGNGDHNAVTLGRAIGTILLADECP